MSSTGTNTIIGPDLPKIPWEDRTATSEEVVWRYSQNPILSWNPIPGVARIFNSAVIPFRGAFAGVFRADHRNGRPQLHAGRSNDGLSWTIDEAEIAWVDEAGAPSPTSYAYDPRVVMLDGRAYVVWCDDFPGPSIGLGVTDDFITFTRLERPLLPFNRNGVLFPRKIGDEYVLLSRPSDSGHTAFGDIVLSHSPDLVYWGKHRQVMGRGGPGWWQGVKIGPGPVPIETREGWLLFYHGVSGPCNGFVYSVGAALLDLDDPTRVRYRTRDYLLTPERDYETVGFVPNVCFPCATLTDAQTGRIAIYYGAADTYTAVAFTQVDELLDHLKANSDVF
ncbi:MAG: glycoside hydrolase family 130 protein [Deltaproteobacteria bacterium]|nr:glycoside hydrolase family 130 protein [Deltaproteobacteria bacterium]